MFSSAEFSLSTGPCCVLLIDLCVSACCSVIDGFFLFHVDAGTAESSTGMKHGTLQQLDTSDGVETDVLKCD